MKNVLNVIADILTLLAVCVAAVGHVFPWLNRERMGIHEEAAVQWLREFQIWHATRSGIALAVLGALVCLSLVFRFGPTMRRLLNLAMFAGAFIALLFELLIFSNYFSGEDQRQIQMRDTDVGFLLAMVPTCFAVAFCLLRMLWTMPPSRPPSPAQLDKRPEPELASKESGGIERTSDFAHGYPVRVEADYPEHSSRLLALAGLLFLFPKALLLLPHIFVLYFLQLAALVVVFVGFLAVLFTGKYPHSLYDFALGSLRWQTRVSAWMFGLVDRYPPFSLR
jgi:hypothetical protein